MAKNETTAGAFDLRNIIGLLMTIYGIILTIWGAVAYNEAAALKTGDVNANLIVGTILLCLGIFFLVWAKVKPQVVTMSLEEAHTAAAAEKASAADSAIVDNSEA